MNRFKRFIGEGSSIKIGEEEFILLPLGTEYIPEFFKAMKNFSGAKEGASIEDTLKNINDEGLKAIQKLIDATLEKSFPDEPETDRKTFGMKYMNILLGKIFEINSAEISDSDKDIVKQVKDLQELRKKQANVSTKPKV